MNGIPGKLLAFAGKWIRNKVVIGASVSLILILVLADRLHSYYFGPNVVKSYMLYIHDGDDFDHVFSTLKNNGCLAQYGSFKQLAWLKDYDTGVRPGAYRLSPGWSSYRLVSVLRSGMQTPVMVTFNNIRTREELAGRLSRQLQCDSAGFLAVLKNDSNALKAGLNPETFPAMFIPNTYSFYWTISPAAFLVRMKREYDLFWNDVRKSRAKSMGLTEDQVSTLASIVQEESNKNDEKPVIAGVYLNRLSKGWPLQADPTIRFALGDYTIRRVLKENLAIESPYNTYLHTGLPPGPINFPEISSIEAVLNYKVHDFFFFCAKEDFSGYHNFAKTQYEHSLNAQKYQAALNKLRIFK